MAGGGGNGRAARFAPVPGGFVRVEGTVLHVLVEPLAADVPSVPARPPIVFTSGLGGCWLDWNAVAGQLRGEFPLVRFDRPGLGFSQPARVAPSVVGEARRIKLLMAALGMPGPYVLVGHSLAGFHVEGFARLWPELVAGVVLVDGSAEPDAVPGPARERRVRFWRGVGDAARRTGLTQLLGPALRQLVISVAARDPGAAALQADPDLVRRVYGSGKLLSAVLVENTTYGDLAVELLELRCERPFPQVPLIVLAATGGVGTSGFHERAKGAQRALAGMSTLGRYVELSDSGHLIQLDRPDAIVTAIREVAAMLSS